MSTHFYSLGMILQRHCYWIDGLVDGVANEENQ